MRYEIAETAIDAATAAARSEILAALRETDTATATGPVGQVGHGAIRLRGPADPPPAAVEEAPGEPAPAAPEPAGHGRIRLR